MWTNSKQVMIPLASPYFFASCNQARISTLTTWTVLHPLLYRIILCFQSLILGNMEWNTEIWREHVQQRTHALPIALQDWKPSSRASDSQESHDQDTQDEEPGEPVHDMETTSGGNSEPEPLGLPLFQDELNGLFEELEKGLPAHPLPGPHSPQVPSPPRDPAATCDRSVQPLRKADASVAPVATPCRARGKEPAPTHDQAWLYILFIKAQFMHNPLDFQILLFENMILLDNMYISLSWSFMQVFFGSCKL